MNCSIVMILILDGNSENVAHAWRKVDRFGEEKSIGDFSRSYQMSYTDQIIEIAPDVHTYF